MNIASAIEKIRPGAKYSLSGHTYEGLVWHSEHLTKPTKEEFDAAVNEAKQEWEKLEYQLKRQKEYPTIGDQLDALWKGGQEMESMRAKIQAVKNKYPKP